MLDVYTYREYVKSIRTATVAGLILFVITAIFIAVLNMTFFDFFHEARQNNSIAQLQSACSIIFTFLLICVGWVQLHKLTKTSKGDFLLRIDNRYGDQAIVKARSYIHELDCQTHAANLSRNDRIQKISVKLMEIAKSELEADKFIQIVNLLDFLETVAYFCNAGFISLTDIDQLLGNSLVYYYEIFTPWIAFNRAEFKNKTYYCEIENVARKVKAITH